MRFSQTPSSHELKLLLEKAKHDGLDPTVIERLTVLMHYVEHRSVRETCKQFNISRGTFHRWAVRFDPSDLRSLLDRSHEPVNLRQPTVALETVELVRRYRMQHHHIGKEKIAELLWNEHAVELSASTVGRVIERECLYFADTPLHWKKRIAHQWQDSGMQEHVEKPSSMLTKQKSVPKTEEIFALQTMQGERQMNEKPTGWKRFAWPRVRRILVVSSVLTNIAFMAMLLGMSLFERVEKAVQQVHTAQEIIRSTDDQSLHAAPSQAPMP
jgi:transposase